MRYCPTCKKDVEDDEKVCRTCGNPTEEKGAGSKRPPIRRVVTPPESGPAEVVPFKVAPNPTPEPHKEPSQTEPHPQASGGRRTGSAHRLEGEAELEAFLAQGYEIYLVAGIEGVGKTELLSAFRQDGFLDMFPKKDGMAIPTLPGTLNCHTIDFGHRKILFVDASGEHFRLLYSDVQTGIDIKDYIGFLKLVARGLRGLVLLVELERLWDERMQERPEDAKQVEVLSWTLSLLRWLMSRGEYNQENNPIKFAKQVNADLMTMRNRLRVPVQVLYSKADLLVNYPIPQRIQGIAPARKLSPVEEDPFLFTYHCLRGLYNTIDIHADYYRFDFAQSLATHKVAKTVDDPDPCGVALAIQWLLDDSWSSRLPMIPTRRWVALQRSLDRVLGRGRRWMRLPDPKGVQA